jgi:16S rRNA (uracil1498-N3)-methyltransferase
MTLPVFVVDADALGADLITLDGDEGHHAAVVKRLRVGERLMLTDTLGGGAECEVRSVSRRGLVAEVLARHVEPVAEPRLVVVQAIAKGDHAERAVDLLTEVGVDRIVPWEAERAVVSWRGEREAKALARWRTTARSAAKQSRRLRFPEVTAPVATGEVARLCAGASLALVLHESASVSVAEVAIPSAGEVVLVVGPEGGISPAELEVLVGAGAVAVRLGATVLRTSTAGVVGAAAVLSRTPRWV